MSDSSYISREPMLEMFVFETNQLLEQLEELFLQLEKNNNITTESINEIFRIMHTIKGSSAMMMFNNISSVAHSVEDLFYYIRENRDKEINCSEICDIVLTASDFVKAEIIKIEAGNPADGKEGELVQRIKSLLSALKGNDGDLPDNKKKTAQSEGQNKFYISSYSKPQPANQLRYIVKVYFEDECQMENIRAYTIIHNLKDICHEIYHRPAEIIEDETCADYIIQNGFDIYFSTNSAYENVKKLFEEALFVKSYDIKSTDSYENEILDLIDKFSSSSGKVNFADNRVSVSDDEKDTTNRNLKQNLISVSITKLDKLMDLVGEIVITESMVTRSPDLKGLQLDSFEKSARQLRKLNDELQDVVMSIRMIPIGTTFHKMHRIVRDMGKQLGKEAELVIIGEETEVDKNIIDNLSDPIMHLIRNAMDHGLENAKERKEKGKAEKGKIVLEARNTGGDVIITISDDGKGLNRDKILKKARRNGLITRPEADLSEKEINSFILLPGFSTKEEVTEFSGRGVGMDVVKKNIEKVGGSVSIESTPSQGTTVIIKIPLTLAIINGMQVAVANSIYTIPTVSIKESFRPLEKDIFIDPDGNEMMIIRGNCYPIVRLHKLFKTKTAVTEISKGIIVVTENDTRTVCLFADKLLGEQQVVVKSLPIYLSGFKVKDIGVGGCTILGDGNISLILDASELINGIV